MSSWFRTWWKILQRWVVEIQVMRIEARIARKIRAQEQLRKKIPHEQLGEWFE